MKARLVTLAILPLLGCSSAAPSEPSIEAEGSLAIALSVPNSSDLPPCDTALAGEVAYVQSTSSLLACASAKWVAIACNQGRSGDVAYASDSKLLVACVDGSWTPVELPPGPAGEQGVQGPAGEPGPQGPAGESLDGINDLDGLPCELANEAAGITEASYPANGGPIALTCKPTGGCFNEAPPNFGTACGAADGGPGVCVSGTVRCDGTCSASDPANVGQPCMGACDAGAGTFTCSGRCSTDPPSYGQTCWYTQQLPFPPFSVLRGGHIRCDGSCG